MALSNDISSNGGAPVSFCGVPLVLKTIDDPLLMSCLCNSTGKPDPHASTQVTWQSWISGISLSTLLDTALFVFRSSWVLAACIVAWLTCLGTCVLDQRRAAYWPPGWQQIEADKNGDALTAWFQNNRPARRLELWAFLRHPHWVFHHCSAWEWNKF